MTIGVDIGGSTTKIVGVRDGKIIQTPVREIYFCKSLDVMLFYYLCVEFLINQN